jgi:phage lysozyme
MQNKYKYNLDLVDNILGITNSANPQNITEKNKAKLGVAYSHSYTYDGINRLVSANGKAKTASYWLDMTYGIMGEPLTKKQKVDSSKVAQSYAFAYLYEAGDHPTAPSQIGHNHNTYDANGNPLTVTNDGTSETREMYWDEDNWLMVLSDNGKTSRYTYNASGERIIKSHGTMEGVYINGAPQGITFHETDNFTLYPASILTVNKNRFTKHYFIGSQRIASRIGTGLFNNVYGRNGSYVTAGQQDYAERMNQIQKQKETYYKQQGIAPGVPTEKGAYGDPENTGVGYNAVLTELGNHDVPQGWVQTPRPNTTPNTNPGPPVSWNDPSNPDDPQAGYGYIPNDTTKEETFFYHSDHLGSTSYITDDKGNITQYDAYLPYGELLVDEHSSSEDMPYKFNGKEMDSETGLYYYGARYMNSVISIWNTPDALIEAKPFVSSYTYCLGNPILLIDPDGNWERNSNGNLVSQRGDNAASYAKYTGYSTDQALSILLANGVTINSNGIQSLNEGQEIFDGTFHLSDVVVYGKSKSSQSIPNSSQRRNVSELSISQQGINFLIAREGMITHPYNDSKGFATIGVGHLLHKSKVTDADRRAWTRFTKNDAKKLLMKDLKETFEPKIRALVKVPLSQNEYDAICSFAFNIGVERGFPSSDFLKELNKGHYDGTLMLRWRRPSEIIGRRKKEVELFNHGVY